MGLLDDAIREHLELKRRRGADPGEISRQESDALGAARRTAGGAPDLTEIPATQSPDAEVATAPAPVTDAQAPPASWQDEQTAIHEAPQPAYEPPPIPPAAGVPPATAADPPPAVAPPPYEPPPAPAYEPPPAPAAPAYEPPAAHDPSPPEPDFDPFPELADEPPIQPPPEPQRGSLLSRFMRGRREHAAEAEPEPEPAQPPPAHDPPPTRDYGSPAPSPHQPPPYTPPPAHEPDVVPADDEPDGEDLLEETPDFLEETPEHDRLWFEQRPPRDFDFDG
jgi:hypothetical protein